MIVRFSILLFSCFLLQFTQAQSSQYWMLTDPQGHYVDFNSQVPTVHRDSGVSRDRRPESAASIDDESGLLLLSDGFRIFDGQFNLIDEEIAFLLQTTTRIFHWPNTPSRYGLIMTPAFLIRNSGLDNRLVIIDYDKTTDHYELISSERWTDLVTSSLADMLQVSDDGYWWVNYSLTDQAFISYFIDEEGIVEYNRSPYNYDRHLSAELHFSSDGRTIAAYTSGDQIIEADGTRDIRSIELFDFDLCSGSVTPVDTISGKESEIFDICFSPNARFLYVMERDEQDYSLYQYDMEAAIIDSSGVEIEDCFFMRWSSDRLGEDIQLAPNGKMYFSTNNHEGKYLSIEEPNRRYPECNCQDSSILFDDFIGRLGNMPIPIHEIEMEVDLLPADTVVCSALELSSGIEDAESFLWSTGSTNSTIVAQESGLYVLTATEGVCVYVDSIQLVVSESTALDVLQDEMVICDEDSYLITVPAINSYVWQDGSTDTSFQVGSSGVYSVTVTDDCGRTAVDSIEVLISGILEDDFIRDTMLCPAESVRIDLSQFESAFWSDGSLDLIRDISASGDYIVEIIDDLGCSAVDSFSIIPLDDIDLLTDSVVLECIDDRLIQTLSVPESVNNILWSTGETAPSIVVDQPGVYTVEVDSEGCVLRDTVEVTIEEDCEMPIDVPVDTTTIVPLDTLSNIPTIDCNIYIPKPYPSVVQEAMIYSPRLAPVHY